MVKWLKKFKTPVPKIIFFSPKSEEDRLIGTEISFFKKKYKVTKVVKASWLRWRSNTKFVPLYAVMGIEIGKSDGGDVEEKVC